MKKIHVIATSDRKFLTVACPSDIPGLLKGATIKNEWFYEQPKELEDFFKANPDQVKYFLKGFSYWITSKVRGFDEKNRYQSLKRKIKKFSKDLLEQIRGLATRIAKEIKKVIRPRKAVYEEQRKTNKVYQNLTSGEVDTKKLLKEINTK